MEKTKKYAEEKAPISFVEDLPIDRETAIIDLATLQRLADNLVGADIIDILEHFNANLAEMFKKEADYGNLKIEDFTKLLDDESAFHKTVRAIVKQSNK